MLAAMCTLRLSPRPAWTRLCCSAMAAGMREHLGPPKLIKSGGPSSAAALAATAATTAAAAAAASSSPEVSSDTDVLPRYSAEQLSSSARCLALLGVRPGPAWARAYLLSCYHCWGSFSPRQWVEMMWALSKMQVGVVPLRLRCCDE